MDLYLELNNNTTNYFENVHTEISFCEHTYFGPQPAEQTVHSTYWFTRRALEHQYFNYSDMFI